MCSARLVPMASDPIPVAAYMRMSTDMQQYSIHNQTRAISAYANGHGMRVVRIYRDDGRSGVTIERRAGLIALLRDISGGAPGFSAVLVLDVSRWGRFQNSDEAAYYEFLCWKAGVRVCYVAELFENDGTPFAMVVKGIKRAMAAEYSRELSAKTTAGHRNLARLGFHQGAAPGYGLRRMLVSASGRPKGLLNHGDRKGFASDRVVLVPGPASELRIIRRIFDLCIAGATCTQIARELNQRSVKNSVGRPWTYQAVRGVLENEKYAGTIVYGRESKPLGTRVVGTSPQSWIRKEGACKAIISREVFEAAQAERREQARRMTDAEVLERVKRLYDRTGRLTGPMISSEPGLPSSHACARRFGSLTNLYRRVGFQPIRNPRYGPVRAWCSAWRASLTAFTVDWLTEAGSQVSQDGWVLTIDDAWTVSFSVLNAHRPKANTGWFNHRRVEASDIVVFARGAFDEPVPRDYLVLPSVLFPVWPRAFYEKNDPAVESCTYPSLAILGDLARLSRMESQLCG